MCKIRYIAGIIKSHRVGQSRFTFVCMENDTIINNTRIHSVTRILATLNLPRPPPQQCEGGSQGECGFPG